MQRSQSRTVLKKKRPSRLLASADLQADHHLLLHAVMKVPGRASLEFLLFPQPAASILVRGCAWIEPRGLSGELYWWVLYPVHSLIFRGVVQAFCAMAADQSHQTCVPRCSG